MKTIHITAAYKPAYIYGGPTLSVSKLCEALIEAKNGVEVFTTTANGKSELEVKANESKIVDGVKVTYFKRLTKDHTHFSPALLWHLNKALRQAQHDNIKLIIHIHTWWNLVSILSCAVAKWHNVPVLLSPRGMLTAYTTSNRNSIIKSLIHNLFGKRLLKYCHIHATSEKEKRDIRNIIKPKSISVIPNLVNLNSNPSVLNLNASPPQPFKLLFLSRIEEKKGLELVFDALSVLDITWHLTIAGDGDEVYKDNLKLKLKDLQLTERISWVGQIANKDKFQLIAKHNLLILTSFNENFANVVVESLSVGTPVLVSDQVGVSDYVNEQQLGWVCRLEANDIKKTLLKAFHDLEKRENIRQLAPEIIRNDFNDQALAKRYLELYKSLVH